MWSLRSTTNTFSPSWLAIRSANTSPVKPAPTISQSTFMLPSCTFGRRLRTRSLASFGDLREAILNRLSWRSFSYRLRVIEADLMLRHSHPLIEQTYQHLVNRRDFVRRIGDPFPRSVIPLVPVPIVFGIG